MGGPRPDSAHNRRTPIDPRSRLHTRLGLAALIALFATGCDRCISPALCSTSADCPAQQRCFEGRCRPACAEDGQCAAGE
ncbi:MAG: hypothetical protein JXR83_14025, partial [Deltaproteobacteria bacterium]|nr:hypothetical protein [Deltaproteobacteria bacterium]